MFLLCLLLVPAVLAAPLDGKIDNHVVAIVNGTLSSIHTTGEPSVDLNLSGLGLRDIDVNVFRNLSHLKNLNLGNNSLSTLPGFLFTNLTSLEYLSLADNAIHDFSNTFIHMNNLKTLNISNNPVRHVTRGAFFGLSKSADILTDGIPLFSMETGLFENPFLRDNNDEISQIDKEQLERDRGAEEPAIVLTDSNRKCLTFSNGNSPALDTSLRVKLCSNEGIVERLEVLTNGSELEDGCKEVEVKHQWNTVSLGQLGITGFNRSWYRLQAYAIDTLDLGNNHIVEVTGEMLNDLPEHLVNVILRNNKIERLVKGRIANEHICQFILTNNSISEIDDGAFENTKISTLILHSNKLNNTRFVATLPNSLVTLDLSKNHIQELPAASFSSHPELIHLYLNHNNISEIKRESFKGLSSLRTLLIQYNNLKKIESGSFEDLKNLNVLHLYNNNLTSLDKGVFTGLKSVKNIVIVHNQLTKLTSDSFDGLPDTLRELHLDFNQIETLENGTFVDVPKVILSLGNNKISKIEKGSFKLPTLYKLFLTNNSLSKLDGDSFEGLDHLRYLSLDGNGITKIEKGIAKNLGGLFGLTLSDNPITRLENGALFGLRKASGSIVDIVNVPLEVIQSGLFEDV